MRGLVLFACAAVLPAQAPAPAPQAPAGLEAAWDIAAVLQEISAHASKMMPMLDKIDAGQWMQKGAPEAYAAQLQSSKDQARSLAEGAKVVAKHPEQLSATIELYFRIQGLETLTGSLAEAMRKYQTPEAAQALLAYTAQNGANRDRLQRYIVNLAAEREHDLQVMDREAQRCRGMLIETPAKSGKKK
jgi:hypothetical protein